MDMSNTINSLVETYKELNMKYRTITDNAELEDIVTRMRNDEIQFSKALKDRLTGIGTASEDMGNATDVVEGSADSIAQIISQFGSARATTLNLLKGIQDSSVWQGSVEDSSTIQQRVEELAQNDSTQLQKLAGIVGN